MLRNSPENITGMLWLGQWKHKDPFSRRSTSGSSEQLSYRVHQKASINYSIIASCSREWFVLNWLTLLSKHDFWQKTAFSHHEIIYQRPAVCLQQKAMMWKIISSSVFLWDVNNKKVGAFSDHQALQNLPGVTCQIQKKKKGSVKYVDRWRDGKISDSSLRFFPSDALFHTWVCMDGMMVRRTRACDIKNQALANT